MTLETQQKAQDVRQEMEKIRKDAQEFRFNLNLLALRSKSPQKFGLHELTKTLKMQVNDWEKQHLDKLQQLYDAL